MSFYSFAKFIVTGALKPIYRFEVIGQENIPREGPVILCSNHISMMDPVALGITSPRPISFMAKEELFKIPLLSQIIKALYAFPVKRGKGDRAALRTGLQILREGRVFGIFPEGTRNKSGKLGRGLSGVGFFALKTDAAVVPCAIIGPYKPFRTVRVVYGKPIDMQALKEKKASAKEATQVIMAHIQEILIQYK